MCQIEEESRNRNSPRTRAWITNEESQESSVRWSNHFPSVHLHHDSWLWWCEQRRIRWALMATERSNAFNYLPVSSLCFVFTSSNWLLQWLLERWSVTYAPWGDPPHAVFVFLCGFLLALIVQLKLPGPLRLPFYSASNYLHVSHCSSDSVPTQSRYHFNRRSWSAEKLHPNILHHLCVLHPSRHFI